jgi:hypothetical protein
LLSKHLYFIFKKIFETKEIYLNKSADRGDIVFSQKSNQVEDQRGHHWMLLPLTLLLENWLDFENFVKYPWNGRNEYRC